METILVIDDSIEILETVALILEDDGYNVVCTCEPQRALSLCGEINFDAVLCDLYMHDTIGGVFSSPLAGIEVISNLAEQHPELPVVLMSGLIDRDALERMRQDSIAGVVSKPFQRGELLAKIGRAAGRTEFGSAELRVA